MSTYLPTSIIWKKCYNNNPPLSEPSTSISEFQQTPDPIIPVIPAPIIPIMNKPVIPMAALPGLPAAQAFFAEQIMAARRAAEAQKLGNLT